VLNLLGELKTLPVLNRGVTLKTLAVLKALDLDDIHYFLKVMVGKSN